MSVLLPVRDEAHRVGAVPGVAAGAARTCRSWRSSCSTTARPTARPTWCARSPRRPAGTVLVDRARRCPPAGWASRTPATSWPRQAGAPTSWSSSTPTWCWPRPRSPPRWACCDGVRPGSARTRGSWPVAGRAAGPAAAAVVVAHLPAAAGDGALTAGRRWPRPVGSSWSSRRYGLRAGRRPRGRPRPGARGHRAGPGGQARRRPDHPRRRLTPGRLPHVRHVGASWWTGTPSRCGRRSAPPVGRRGRRRRCSLLYVVPPLVAVAGGRRRRPGAGPPRRSSATCSGWPGGSVSGPGHRRPGLARRAGPPGLGAWLFVWLVARSYRAPAPRSAGLEGPAADRWPGQVPDGPGRRHRGRRGRAGRAARLAAAGHRVTVFEQADAGRRQARPARARDGGRHLPVRHRAEPAHRCRRSSPTCSPRRAPHWTRNSTWSPWTRWSGTSSPTASCSTPAPDPAVFADRIAAAFGPEAAQPTGARLWRRAGAVLGHLLAPRSAPPVWTRRRTLAGWPGGWTTSPPSRPAGRCAALGRSYLDEPHLRTLLDRYATYAGSDPRRAPAALLAIPYAELAFGGWYVRGGLATPRRRAGAAGRGEWRRVHTGTRVARVETAGGRVTGVRLADGASVAGRRRGGQCGRRCSSTATCCPTRGGPPGSAGRSLGGFVLLLGVRGRTATPGLAHHTVFFPDRLRRRVRRALRPPAGPRRSPIRPSSSPSPTTRPCARPGHEAWFVLVNAPPHGPADRRGLARPRAGRRLRRPGARDAGRAAASTCATACSSARSVRRPTSSGTPARPAVRSTARPSHGLTGLLRPPNRGPVRGLYLVGGSTHPGGGLPMVTLSARDRRRPHRPRLARATRRLADPRSVRSVDPRARRARSAGVGGERRQGGPDGAEQAGGAEHAEHRPDGEHHGHRARR